MKTHDRNRCRPSQNVPLAPLPAAGAISLCGVFNSPNGADLKHVSVGIKVHDADTTARAEGNRAYNIEVSVLILVAFDNIVPASQ